MSMFAVVRIVDLKQSRTIAGMWSEGKGASDDSGTRQYALLMNMPAYGGLNKLVPHVSSEGGVTRRADGTAFPWCVDYAVTASEVPTETWCMLGFTYDAKHLRAYINGVLDELKLEPFKHRRMDRYFMDEGPGEKDRRMNPYYRPPSRPTPEPPSGGPVADNPEINFNDRRFTRSIMHTRLLLFLAVLPAAPLAAERINQEGRILGPEPTVTSATLFNTPAADAIAGAMQILPLDNPWNEDISARPLLANSAAMIAQIRADLASNRRTLRAFHEMNYVLVPDSQPNVPITFVDYPDESDDPPYPIPASMPVETWPRETGALTLQQWQQDVNGDGGDRHSIIVMPGTGGLWETWQALLVGSAWQASNGAKFDLRSNALRPAGWTSGDAAGLPMFPALVRYDECVRGMVEHAMRIVVKRTRREYLYPANHYASITPATEVNVPAMGQRMRLRADFAIPAGWTVFEKAVCLGLKKYGALVADNGGFLSISVTPDDRYPAGAFDNLSTIDVNEFEIVQSTGPTEGPRAPGAPTAAAGPDGEVVFPGSVALRGTVTGTGTSVEWTKYSGPGGVVFGSPAQAATSATFGMPGTYTLMLHARDGMHAVARDAVVVNVTLPVSIVRAGAGVTVSFPSAVGQTYRVERTTNLAAGPWTVLADNLAGTGGARAVPDAAVLGEYPAAFYRVGYSPF